MILFRDNNDKFVVSTISLEEEVRMLDDILGMWDEVLDRPAKLSQPGNYETMVFPGNDEGEITDFTELDFARYSTKEEAEKGHKEFVAKYIGE